MNIRLSLPIQLLLVIAFVLLFGGVFSEHMVQACYTFSVIFKECLSFLLPFIVFAFVLTGILSFKKNAPLVLLILIGMIFSSNAFVAMFSYAVVCNLISLITCSVQSGGFAIEHEIMPLFSFSLPQYIRSEYAMIASVLLGLFFSFVPFSPLERAVGQLKQLIETILNYTVIPLLPLYVLGFLLKIRYEGTFIQLMQQYGSTVLLIVAIQISYLLFMYLLAHDFSLKRAMKAINNALPSYLTAFSTMSSTATVPVSVETATKNTGNRALSAMAMPIMANVHLLGDSIGIPVLAMVTMILFKGCLPDLGQYVAFLFYFCTSMFAVSGIPGGAIIVMIPILVSIFGFTADMVSIITALYLLLDSFGTAANVMGDGALVIVVNRVLKRLGVVS